MYKKVIVYYKSDEDCITTKDKLCSILDCNYLIFDKDERNFSEWSFNTSTGKYECNNCKTIALYNNNRGFELSKYCPNCGKCMSNGM